MYNNIMEYETINKIKELGDILTAAEIAEALRVSRPTILAWVEEGKLKAFSPGPRSHRFYREDVLKFLADYHGLK